MTELKIMNWNIMWGLGYPTSKINQLFKGMSYFHNTNSSKTIDKIEVIINELKPDILTLQEIDNGSKRNYGFNQAQALSSKTGMTYYEYGAEKNWFNYFNDGNCLMSKDAPLGVTIEPLPYKLEKRNAIFADYEVNNKKFTVITTHLGAHKANKDERLKQMIFLTDKINKIKNAIVLIGDFNCEPDSDAFQYLLANTKLKQVINDKTYPAYDAQKTFDNIVISEGITVKEAKILNVKESDHFPVYAILKF
jgi:endonuclease/exonuclease/phosphatase family metal-dependent hydrolase